MSHCLITVHKGKFLYNAYLRNDRKIKFRMVSVQHFINEAPGVGLRCTDRSASYDESDSKPEPYALLSSSRGTLMS